MNVGCKYHDADVVVAFPGFAGPDREDILTIDGWEIGVGNNGCDGIVAVCLGPEGAPTLTLTLGADQARALAAELVRQAEAEDAKIDDDFDDDDDA